MINGKLKFQKKFVSGWGRNVFVESFLAHPESISSVQMIISRGQKNSIIARGLGKSYGDAAILKNGKVLNLSAFNNLTLNKKENTITVGAGLSFSEILEYIIPKGYFLPVVAGTSLITVGGAIASDIHGKNHLRKGSIGKNIKSITLINGKSEIIKLSPTSESNKELFWATIGGMGLTGIIIEATLSVFKISNSYLKVKTKKHSNIESIIQCMGTEDKFHEYNVAWIDSQSTKGRGISQHANHLDNINIQNGIKTNSLTFKTSYQINFPKILNFNIVNKFTVKLMNKIYYHSNFSKNKVDFQKISKFFFPLDRIKNWNLAYGRNGFLQYQFLIPEKESSFLIWVLREFRKNDSYSYVTVLKKFGESNLSPLSFPEPGWSLSLDIPNNSIKNLNLLEKIDKELNFIGGKIYLAKDARMRPNIIKNSYPKIEEFYKYKKILDPESKFASDLSKRLFEL